jgi:hypothetical protein
MRSSNRDRRGSASAERYGRQRGKSIVAGAAREEAAGAEEESSQRARRRRERGGPFAAPPSAAAGVTRRRQQTLDLLDAKNDDAEHQAIEDLRSGYRSEHGSSIIA